MTDEQLTDDDLRRMRADAEDYRDLMPPMASHMDTTPEFYTWELGGYVLRLVDEVERLRAENQWVTKVRAEVLDLLDEHDADQETDDE